MIMWFRPRTHNLVKPCTCCDSLHISHRKKVTHHWSLKKKLKITSPHRSKILAFKAVLFLFFLTISIILYSTCYCQLSELQALQWLNLTQSRENKWLRSFCSRAMFIYVSGFCLCTDNKHVYLHNKHGLRMPRVSPRPQRGCRAVGQERKHQAVCHPSMHTAGEGSWGFSRTSTEET